MLNHGNNCQHVFAKFDIKIYRTFFPFFFSLFFLFKVCSYDGRVMSKRPQVKASRYSSDLVCLTCPALPCPNLSHSTYPTPTHPPNHLTLSYPHLTPPCPTSLPPPYHTPSNHPLLPCPALTCPTLPTPRHPPTHPILPYHTQPTLLYPTLPCPTQPSLPYPHHQPCPPHPTTLPPPYHTPLNPRPLARLTLIP